MATGKSQEKEQFTVGSPGWLASPRDPQPQQRRPASVTLPFFWAASYPAAGLVLAEAGGRSLGGSVSVNAGGNFPPLGILARVAFGDDDMGGTATPSFCSSSEQTRSGRPCLALLVSRSRY